MVNLEMALHPRGVNSFIWSIKAIELDLVHHLLAFFNKQSKILQKAEPFILSFVPGK